MTSTAVGKEHSGRALLVVTALTLSCAADTMTVDLACDGPAPQAAVLERRQLAVKKVIHANQATPP